MGIIPTPYKSPGTSQYKQNSSFFHSKHFMIWGQPIFNLPAYEGLSFTGSCSQIESLAVPAPVLVFPPATLCPCFFLSLNHLCYFHLTCCVTLRKNPSPVLVPFFPHLLSNDHSTYLTGPNRKGTREAAGPMLARESVAFSLSPFWPFSHIFQILLTLFVPS